MFMIVVEPARDMQDVHHFLSRMHGQVITTEALPA
jgi:hypothetical protein